MSAYIIQKAIDRKDMSAKALKALDGRTYGLQPKWDGCHLVIKFHRAELGGFQDDDMPEGSSGQALVTGYSLESATGEPNRACEHIALALIQSAGDFDLAGYAVTGEVWVENTPFPDISGAFRRHSPQPHLKFVLLDIVKLDENGGLNDPRPWEDRLRTVMFKEHPSLIWAGLRDPRIISPVQYAEDLKKAGGYDGAILRDIHAPYKVGRCRNGEVIKVKPLLSLDLLCIGASKAVGEKTGRDTVALLVQLKDGIVGKVSTGLNHEEQADPGRFIGKIVQVDSMGWTEDGKLREPRFIGERHDKVKADY